MLKITTSSSQNGKLTLIMISVIMRNTGLGLGLGSWANNNLELQVKWTLGDVTWEPISSCKDLEALDKSVELWGVKHT